MKKTAAFTSTLPTELLEQLAEFSKKLNLPKNKIIEKSLRQYLENLKRAEYIRSFQRAAQDSDQQELAEMGLEDYLKIIDEG
jgi:predicted DNA-binding protein